MGPTRATYAQLRLRHKRVHFLSSLARGQHKPGPTRLLGFPQAVAEHGDGDADEVVHYAGSVHVNVPTVCRELFEKRAGPLAGVCSTGYLAGILREPAMLQGLMFPTELEIIAIGDIPHNEANHLGPSATTV